VPRKVFGPQKQEVRRRWRNWGSSWFVLHTKVYPVEQLGRNRWMGPVARVDGRRNLCRVSVRKHEGKRPLGRPRRRW
jgi:hypothetical protein